MKVRVAQDALGVCERVVVVTVTKEAALLLRCAEDATGEANLYLSPDEARELAAALLGSLAE